MGCYTKGGNGSGQGQRAPCRGAVHTKARQPAFVFATRCREDKDDADVLACIFLIHIVTSFALVDIGSTHSYVSSIVSVSLGIFTESTGREVSIISLMGQSVSLC